MTRGGRPKRFPTRDYFIQAGICPCDPTRGDSCRLCDGTQAARTPRKAPRR